MRAVAYHRYGTPDVVALEEVETPTPEASQVRIKIHAAVVSAADSAFRSGTPWFARLFTGVTRPKKPILGTEFAGEVDAVDEGVSRFRVGDRVFAAGGTELGAHAEFICLAEDGALALMPKEVTFPDAAAICEGGLTALPFLRDVGRIQSGQTLLINGASGSVGSSAVQLAKHFGAEVTGVCSTANLDLVMSLGADHVIDYTQTDFATNGRTYDILFDAVAKSSLSRCKRSLTANGTYLRTVPSLAIIAQMLWTSMFGRKKAKISFAGLRSATEKSEDLVFLRGLVEAGELQPVIGGSFPMDRASEAHVLVDTGHKRGSAVMTMI